MGWVGAVSKMLADPKIQEAIKAVGKEPTAANIAAPAAASAMANPSFASNFGIGGGSGVAYPTVAQETGLPPASAGGLPPASAGGLPPAAAGATPTPGMSAGPSFAKPTRFNPFRRGSGYGGPQPGSLGDLFKNMMMQRFERPPSNRVDEYNRPTPVNPSDQYFNPTDLLRGSSPFGDRGDDESNTTISKFLGSGPSGRGGIADLLRAFGG